MNNNNNQEYYERWTRVERYQHWILAVSFIILVITGFALKYPEAASVQPILLLEGQLALRGWINRIAAVVMVVLAFLLRDLQSRNLSAQPEHDRRQDGRA